MVLREGFRWRLVLLGLLGAEDGAWDWGLVAGTSRVKIVTLGGFDGARIDDGFRDRHLQPHICQMDQMWCDF